MDTTYNLSGGFKPTIKRFADLDGPDFFPTPAWATYALIDNEKFSGEWCLACLAHNLLKLARGADSVYRCHRSRLTPAKWRTTWRAKPVPRNPASTHRGARIKQTGF